MTLDGYIDLWFSLGYAFFILRLDLRLFAGKQENRQAKAKLWPAKASVSLLE